jgi:uncharacterized protein (TIGR03067 family)
MIAMLLTASIVVAEPPAGSNQPTKNLDGNWTVVALEKDGKPEAEAKDMTVKAQGNTFTCNGKDGKPSMTWQVTFGPNGTIKVTETSAASTTTSDPNRANDPNKATDANKADKGSGQKSGVYVLTADFLALCLHDDGGIKDRDNPNRGTDTAARDAASPGHSKCTIILKREGSR